LKSQLTSHETGILTPALRAAGLLAILYNLMDIVVLRETNVNQFEAKSSLYWTFHSIMTEIGGLFQVMQQMITFSRSATPDSEGAALFLLFKLISQRKNVVLGKGSQNSIVSTIVLLPSFILNFSQKQYLKELETRREVAMNELKCIREIHATLNCRPGGRPEALLLKKLVNRQNKLRPEVTLTFSAATDGPNDYGANLLSRRSAIDVLNDTTPRAEPEQGAGVLQGSWQKLLDRLDGCDNDLNLTDLNLGYGTSQTLDHSPCGSWKTPSLTIGSTDPNLWQLPSAPYSDIPQTAYSVIDLADAVEQPSWASDMKENYQYAGDLIMDLDSAFL
jgi:hypothetical protein